MTVTSLVVMTAFIWGFESLADEGLDFGGSFSAGFGVGGGVGLGAVETGESFLVVISVVDSVDFGGEGDFDFGSFSADESSTEKVPVR